LISTWLGMSVHFLLLISCLYPYPVWYVHIQSSCTKSDLFELTPLCRHWQLIHSHQPCDVDNFIQHDHLSYKLITSTSNVLVWAHIVLWQLPASAGSALEGLVLYSFSILSVDRPSQSSLEHSLWISPG
jgi:hypothetical protein